MRKESFPYQRRSKLRPRRNGTFQVLERVKDNAYRLDLPVQSNVSVTFNVSDVRPSNTGDDLRANPLQVEANDEAKDPVLVPIGPVTRARSKRFKEDLNTSAQHICDRGWQAMRTSRLHGILTSRFKLQLVR